MQIRIVDSFEGIFFHLQNPPISKAFSLPEPFSLGRPRRASFGCLGRLGFPRLSRSMGRLPKCGEHCRVALAVDPLIFDARAVATSQDPHKVPRRQSRYHLTATTNGSTLKMSR